MASAGAKKKEKRTEDKKKSLKDVEQAMNKISINLGENASGQNTSEETLDAYFIYMAKTVANLPNGEKKHKLTKQLEEEKVAATEAKGDFEKQLMTRVGDIQRMRFDDGDQSPLVGDDADRFQSHLTFDYSRPLNPFSRWITMIYTGNYEGMMSILEGKSDIEVMMLLGMRESSMNNMPALLHLVCGAKVFHSNQPSMLAEKRRMEEVMEVKDDHMRILEKLIQLGADLSVKDVAGYTFLHHCFSGSSNATTSAMAKVVLKAGFNPNIQDRFGFTPLVACITALHNAHSADPMLAMTNIELLLKYEANPNIEDFEHGVSVSSIAAKAFPDVWTLIGKYSYKQVKRERERLKTEMGGSLDKCLQCGKDGSTRYY